MTKPLDRVRLRKLLGMLGSSHDGEILNAARHIDAMLRDSDATWQTLIPDADRDETAAFADAGTRTDLQRLDELLDSDRVDPVLKIRLTRMRRALVAGKLTSVDRRLVQILHRKAVLDGAVVTP